MVYKVSNFFDYLSLIQSDVFFNCVKLNNINFQSKIEESINITNNISFLGEGIFENCISINDVYYDPSVNYVSNELFKNCITLNSIEFSNKINIIQEAAFENCLSLTNITMPQELNILESNSFKNCSNLETLQFYEQITSISTTAFQYCNTFLIPNTVLILNSNNSYINSYFSSLFPVIKIYKLSLSNILFTYINNVTKLLNLDNKLIKEYTYQAIGILLNGNGSIVNIDNLINININQEKIAEFRNLTLKFIFDSNSSLCNYFIIKLQSLSLTIPNLTNTSYISVYKEGYKNINVTNNFIQNIDLIGAYCLLDNTISKCFLNDYKINVFVSQNKYYIVYSNDNFQTDTQIISQFQQENNLSNYTILGGPFNDVIIYRRGGLFNFMNLFLENFQININAGIALPILSELTNSMYADAYATINIPLSVAKNTFLYWSDSINVDDVIEEGVKFKVLNYEGWSNIYLTNAIVYEGDIPYYKKNTDVIKKQIKFDFIRYLALKIFKTANGADLFRNNEAVTASLDNASNLQFRNKLNELENLGEFLNESSQYNISRVIFRQILSQSPERIVPNDGEWTPMPLYVGDKICIKLIINPDINQRSVLGNNIVPEISQRSYLVELNLISG